MDQTDIAKIVQFQHVQSFVLDLKVNDLIQSRGFDMSVISSDQLESVREMAEHCAKGDLPKTKHVAAGMANVIASAMLEQKRLPKSVLPSFQTWFAMIQVGQPEIYRLAEQFVASVERHGYADRTAICRVIDECAALSFQATGDSFDPVHDLVEERPTEWLQDKHPDFLPGFPVSVKLDAFRTAARHGIGPKIGCELYFSDYGKLVIQLSDPSGQIAVQPRIECDLPPHISGQVLPPRQLHPMSAPITMPTITMPVLTTLSWQPSPEHTNPCSFSTGHNYMAGVGLWLSRAGFEEQQAGEHPYGYAFNNPVNNIDPTGFTPSKHPKRKPKPKPKPSCPAGYTLKLVTAYGDNAGCSGSGCNIAYPKQCGCKNRLPEVGDCAIDQNNKACQPGQYIIILKQDGTTTSCRACDAGQGHGGIDLKVKGPNTVKNVSQYWDTDHYCIKCSDTKP